MSIESLFTVRDYRTLQEARSTYGAHKQIGVAAEECTELAKELIKAFRYDNFEDAVEKTKQNVTEEVADVLIVMDHILRLYDITESDLQPQIRKKLDRLRYWLDHSDNIEFTTQYRELTIEDQAEAEAFDKYQKKYYAAMAEIDADSEPKSSAVKIKNTDIKGVYAFDDGLLVDKNDEKYREE